MESENNAEMPNGEVTEEQWLLGDGESRLFR